MPYKDLEKHRASRRAWREKNKEKIKKQQKEYHQKNREKLRIVSLVYNATHKEVRANYRATHKEENKAYREKNKEKIKRKQQENYQKNREAVILRTKKYREEHLGWYKEYHKNWYAKIRLEVLAKVDPALKCAMCGCDDTRFLEVNHIKGGGRKERIAYRNGKQYESHNMILLIHNGKRGLEDLNLLCRVCNSLDHLERQFGKTGLRVVWDNQVTKYTEFLKEKNS